MQPSGQLLERGSSEPSVSPTPGQGGKTNEYVETALSRAPRLTVLLCLLENRSGSGRGAGNRASTFMALTSLPGAALMGPKC